MKLRRKVIGDILRYVLSQLERKDMPLEMIVVACLRYAAEVIEKDVAS